MVDKSTLVSDIFLLFYNRIKSQVTTVTLSISPGSQTIQTYASSYSDVNFSSKDNFPILVINSPRVPQEQFTFTKTNVNGTIDLEIYCTNSQAADKFIDAINTAIETYKGDFADLGLQMLELDDTDNDFVEHGSIKVHIRTARWRFQYKYSRTRAY
ncbi:MAG: hypothetical protein ACFFG0_03115 [Candidatus Thorarchaeota archaeon]